MRRAQHIRSIALIGGVCALIASLALALAFGPPQTRASSHREAPLIATDAQADNTDLYAFVTPDAPTTVTIIANYIPFETPDGAPNYFQFSDDVLYEINIDNVGDALSHVKYQFRFNTTTQNGETFLYPTGPITSLTDPDFNVRQTYTITRVVTPITGPVVTTQLGAGLPVPPINVGSKSTPNYDTLATAALSTVDSGKIKVFAGPRDDPFWVDLGAIFDLLSLRPQASPIGYPTGPTVGIDSVSGFNVHSIVLQVPIADILSSQSDPVIGVWATASRQTTCTRGGFSIPACSGAFVQISRLGMPLVNEVVMPRALKDAFNSIPPTVDQGLYLTNDATGNLLEKSVMNPELGRLLCGLYGVPMPRDANSDCSTEYTNNNPATGRSDLFEIFLTGIKLDKAFTITTAAGTQATLPIGTVVNQPSEGTNGSGGGIVAAEMLRLNTALKPGAECSATPNYAFGLLGGDACGFPNGRRLQDDVTRISLLAVAGIAWDVTTGDTSFTFNNALVPVLTDGTTHNDKPFLPDFPYVASPHQGQEWDHQSIVRSWLTFVVQNSSAGTPNSSGIR
jgi:Domain of unknown function (DUF4331)